MVAVKLISDYLFGLLWLPTKHENEAEAEDESMSLRRRQSAVEDRHKNNAHMLMTSVTRP